MNDWMTPSEVAREARVSKATLYRYWTLGIGPRYSQVRGRRVVHKTWLHDWLLSQEAA